MSSAVTIAAVRGEICGRGAPGAELERSERRKSAMSNEECGRRDSGEPCAWSMEVRVVAVWLFREDEEDALWAPA